MSPPPSVKVEPEGAAPAERTVIWLHGLGADGHDFEPIVPELALPSELRVRFVFPHAPIRPITINAGYRMRGWYDIRDLESVDREDADGIRESERLVHELIEDEKSLGVPARRIVLGGFSQGGALALHTALRYGERLAGVAALSAYLPLAGSIEAERSDANRDLPIFLAHGTADPIVAFEHGHATSLRLAELGYPVTWSSYPMGHSVCGDEIRELGDWLLLVLSAA
ncbi:MAG TPA: alpha/beta fold hydrolase [Planctomycetota bacterium]|nr:alpha/beta fold hydrolase [Planctomycetota bacterium]